MFWIGIYLLLGIIMMLITDHVVQREGDDPISAVGLFIGVIFWPMVLSYAIFEMRKEEKENK